MNSLNGFLNQRNKATTRVAALTCNLLAVIIFGAIALVVVWLLAALFVHQGADVTFVSYAAFAVSLVVLYFLITKLPELELFENKKVSARPLITYIPNLLIIHVSNVIVPPFIPPRHTSFAH